MHGNARLTHKGRQLVAERMAAGTPAATVARQMGYAGDTSAPSDDAVDRAHAAGHQATEDPQVWRRRHSGCSNLSGWASRSAGHDRSGGERLADSSSSCPRFIAATAALDG